MGPCRNLLGTGDYWALTKKADHLFCFAAYNTAPENYYIPGAVCFVLLLD